MQCIDTIPTWLKTRAQFNSNKSLGFVPTMGNLHDGHAALIAQSVAENDITVVSIIVNPTQFNQASDFENYPKTLHDDSMLLAKLGVDYCFCPSPEAMYPDAYRFQVHKQEETPILEGAFRPGHFTGMLTIVLKLLNLVRANKAYFGEKDYQQLGLVRDMVEAFFIPTQIIACPTLRDAHGLALSSRNNRLSQEGLKRARTFARIFRETATAEAAAERLHQEGFKTDYVQDWENRRFAAVYVEDVRLIDNFALPDA